MRSGTLSFSPAWFQNGHQARQSYPFSSARLTLLSSPLIILSMHEQPTNKATSSHRLLSPAPPLSSSRSRRRSLRRQRRLGAVRQQKLRHRCTVFDCSSTLIMLSHMCSCLHPTTIYAYAGLHEFGLMMHECPNSVYCTLEVWILLYISFTSDATISASDSPSVQL